MALKSMSIEYCLLISTVCAAPSRIFAWVLILDPYSYISYIFFLGIIRVLYNMRTLFCPYVNQAALKLTQTSMCGGVQGRELVL